MKCMTVSFRPYYNNIITSFLLAVLLLCHCYISDFRSTFISKSADPHIKTQGWYIITKILEAVNKYMTKKRSRSIQTP